MVFPYQLGPALHRFSTSLLWNGRLDCSVQGWVSSRPQEKYLDVWKRAIETQHPLEPTLRSAAEQHAIAIAGAEDQLKQLSPLRERVLAAPIVGPGNRQAYAEWDSVFKDLMPRVLVTLADPYIIQASATEFVWRVYELYLELDGNPDLVLEHLASQAKTLGGEGGLLLLQSALHKYAITKVVSGSLIVDSSFVLAVMEALGNPMMSRTDKSPRAIPQLGFFLFDSLLHEHVPPLAQQGIASLAVILEEREEALEAARRRCLREAEDLGLDNNNDNAAVERRLRRALENLHDEIGEVLYLTSKKMRDLVNSVLEDRIFWTSVAGLVGTLFAPLPAVVPASAAMTAFGCLGAAAVKASRERREALEKSDWAIVYYLHRELKKTR